MANLKQYAKDVGLNTATFEKDILDQSLKAVIDDDKKQAAKAGVRGTPGFFVNGRFLRGAKPFEDFAKVINAELKKAGHAIPAGAQTGS